MRSMALVQVLLLLVGVCHLTSGTLSSRPELPELQQFPSKDGKPMNLYQEIGAKYYDVGICLLEDKNGAKLGAIEADNKNMESKMREIFRLWLQGGGKRPETWGTVVVCLRQVGLEFIAESIEAKYGKTPGERQRVIRDKNPLEETQPGEKGMQIENIMYGDAEKRQIIRDKKPLPSPKPGSKLHKLLLQYCQEVILIIHTVNDNEKWAGLANMKPPKIESDEGEVLQQSIDLYEANWIVLGEFGGYKAALIQTEMGVESHNELLDALDTFPNAKYIVAVGVAGAASSKAKICDVIVSKWIDGVSNMKFTKEGNIIFRASGARFTPALQKLRNIFARGTETWLSTDDFNCTKDGHKKPRILPGSIISSSVLMDNQKLRDDFVQNDPEAVGIEMEGFKLAEIQDQKKNYDQRDLGIIVIKGISDLGDGTKSKEWQFTAAMAAASYARHKLEETNGFLRQESPESKSASPQGQPKPKGEEIKKLNDLIQAVKDVGDWHGLCTNLGVNEGVLDTLTHASSHENAKKASCLKAYFNMGEAYWSDVVEAVAIHPIDNIRLATKIANAHGLKYEEIMPKDEL